MPMACEANPVRHCAACGLPLERKCFGKRSGKRRLEGSTRFLRRLYCNQECAGDGLRQRAPSLPLTARQRVVLRFIERYIAEHGYSPNWREIGDGIGVRSSNAVASILRPLERKGFITRSPSKARSIRPAKTSAVSP